MHFIHCIFILCIVRDRVQFEPGLDREKRIRVFLEYELISEKNKTFKLRSIEYLYLELITVNDMMMVIGGSEGDPGQCVRAHRLNPRQTRL